LRELEEASRHLEDDTLTSEHEKWLSMLLAPGSSLGGARPKACIVSPDGDLWIAKFPAKNDTVNTSAWEYATMLMARDADLDVPDVKKETFSAKGSTFLVKRFDRAGTRRIHFASAMTLLGKTDGMDADDGCSYLDIAEFIIQQSVRPQQDLRELWRRIVFSIAVSNTDDHLRNHGFLFGNEGWLLSPVYDVNPNPQGLGLSLNISLDDNSLDFDVAREVAPFFRLKPQEAEAILDKIVAIVSNWRNYARRSGLDDGEMEMMASAFRV
jgi:serine/threonine-protein kinase HipA